MDFLLDMVRIDKKSLEAPPMMSANTSNINPKTIRHIVGVSNSF
jgi:hypothetical protein